MAAVMQDIVALALGLAGASFASLCAFRMPRGEPLVFDLSKCDHCGELLRWHQKLPIIGYLTQFGRSRCCDRPIPFRYPILEGSTAAFFLLLSRQHPAPGTFITAIMFVNLLIVGTLIDLDHRIIPDRITVTGIVLGMVVSIFSVEVTIWWSVAGILVCGGFLFLAGVVWAAIARTPLVIGGGDIKFAAMIGAFLGWEQGIMAVYVAASAGAIFGLLRIIESGAWRERHELPFGPFLALGALVALLWGAQIRFWYEFSIQRWMEQWWI